MAQKKSPHPVSVVRLNRAEFPLEIAPPPMADPPGCPAQGENSHYRHNWPGSLPGKGDQADADPEQSH